MAFFEHVPVLVMVNDSCCDYCSCRCSPRAAGLALATFCEHGPVQLLYTCCCLHSVAPSSLENAWNVNAFLQYDQSLHRVSSAPPTMHWHAAVEAAAVKAVKAAVLRLLLAAAPTVAMLS